MASAVYCYFGSGNSWREASSFESGRPHYRVGEARNPGPAWIHEEACFAIGTANPTGIRGKEREILDLPQGIWAISETHLSQPLMRPTLNKLKYLGSQDSFGLCQELWFHFVPGLTQQALGAESCTWVMFQADRFAANGHRVNSSQAELP